MEEIKEKKGGGRGRDEPDISFELSTPSPSDDAGPVRLVLCIARKEREIVKSR